MVCLAFRPSAGPPGRLKTAQPFSAGFAVVESENPGRDERGVRADISFVSGGTRLVADADPALKCWAIFCRPLGWGWGSERSQETEKLAAWPGVRLPFWFSCLPNTPVGRKPGFGRSAPAFTAIPTGLWPPAQQRCSFGKGEIRIFEQMIHQDDQFPHDGGEGDLWGFASGDQAVVEGAEPLGSLFCVTFCRRRAWHRTGED